MSNRSRTALIALLVIASLFGTASSAMAVSLVESPIVQPGVISEGQAFYEAGKLLYMSDRSNDAVRVYSGTSLVKTIPVGDYPLGVCVDEAGKKVYVVNYGDKSVSVISAVTNTVTATFALTYSPYGIAVNETTKKLYITDMWDSTTSVVDALTGIETNTRAFSGNGQPTRVAVNSTTNKVYIYHFGSGKVVVLDGQTDLTYNVVDAYVDRGVSLTVNETTNKIYACSEGGECFEIDGASNVATRLDTAATSVGINESNNRLYMSYGGNLNVISGTDHSVLVSNFYSDVPAEFSAWSPLEAKLYVYSTNYNQLATIQDGEPPAAPAAPSPTASVPAASGWSVALGLLLGMAAVAAVRRRSAVA